VGIFKKILDAFVDYFVEIKSSGCAFWLKQAVPTGVEFISAPVTAFAFLLARLHFDSAPNVATYTTLLVAYFVLTALVAGLACLAIPAARGNVGENMRKFVSVALVISTLGALISAVESRFELTAPIAKFLQSAGWDLFDPDVVATCVPSIILAMCIVFWMERLRGVRIVATVPAGGAPADLLTSGITDYVKGSLFLLVAAWLGLGIMIGVAR
jgi:hypothetical protein